jgi:hypothetical protein
MWAVPTPQKENPWVVGMITGGYMKVCHKGKYNGSGEMWKLVEWGCPWDLFP